MKKAYVLVYSDGVGARESIKGWLNSDPNVITWRTDLPHCFYLVSEADSETLARSFRRHANDKGRFLIMEASDNRFGWLPNESWYLLRNKKLKPKNG